MPFAVERYLSRHAARHIVPVLLPIVVHADRFLQLENRVLTCNVISYVPSAPLAAGNAPGADNRGVPTPFACNFSRRDAPLSCKSSYVGNERLETWRFVSRGKS